MPTTEQMEKKLGAFVKLLDKDSVVVDAWQQYQDKDGAKYTVYLNGSVKLFAYKISYHNGDYYDTLRFDIPLNEKSVGVYEFIYEKLKRLHREKVAISYYANENSRHADEINDIVYGELEAAKIE